MSLSINASLSGHRDPPENRELIVCQPSTALSSIVTLIGFVEALAIAERFLKSARFGHGGRSPQPCRLHPFSSPPPILSCCSFRRDRSTVDPRAERLTPP